MSDELLLEVEDLEVAYGASRVLFGVSASVRFGGSLAVLGTNGAGKTSLARALAGLVPPKAGRIRFAGTDVTGWSPHRMRRAGFVYIPEGRGVFPGLTVRENLRMGLRWVRSNSRKREGLDYAIDTFPVLGERLDQRAGTLSGGEQQMLSLARALAVRPSLLVVDEVSLGLAPLVVDTVFDRLQAVRASGIGVVMIEQFVHKALQFCDNAVILRRGEVVWEGPADLAEGGAAAKYLG